MSDSTSPFLLFLHIPKTAGTTLGSVVDAQYGARAVLTYYNQNSTQLLDNLPCVLAERRGQYRALIGHYPFGVHRALAGAASYVTFLRDPVRRSVSAYFENLKSHPDRLRKTDGATMTIAEAIAAHPSEFENNQVRYLAEFPHRPTERHLDQIEQSFTEHFRFVGVIERFTESMLLLSKKLGWKPCLWGRLNPGPSNPRVPADTLAELETRNALGRALHTRAMAALDAEIATAGAPFAAALAELNAALATVELGSFAAKIVDPELLPKVAAYLLA